MHNESSDHTQRIGLWFGLGAYSWWGMIPLYFRLVREVLPIDVLAHRIVWSCAALLIVIVVLRRLGDWLRAWRSRQLIQGLAISTLLIAANWFIYIYAVSTEQVLQASLGYFITPLANVLLGIFVLGERLRRVQGWAIGLATAGVAYQAAIGGVFPSIALGLAISFSLYGLARKLLQIDALIGLSVETTLLLPLAVLYLLLSPAERAYAPSMLATLALGGPVTIVPLLLFAGAARRLPMTTLGFLQYLAPSLQFFVAILVLEESLDAQKLVSFSLIWSAVAMYSFDAWRVSRRRASMGQA